MSDLNMSVVIAPNFIDTTFESNLKNRKIILNEEISSDVVEKVIMQIINWNEEDKDIPIENRKVITIYINTPGGSVSDGFVACDVISSSKTPISTVTLGMAASMGSYLAMAGHKGLRYAYPFSTFLIHSGSMCLSGGASEVESTVKYYTDMKADIADFIYKHTKISKQLYKKMQSSEWYLSSKEGLKHGLIDIIIGIND